MNKEIYKKFSIFREFFHDAGQFYWGTVKSWYSKISFQTIKVQFMN